MTIEEKVIGGLFAAVLIVLLTIGMDSGCIALIAILLAISFGSVSIFNRPGDHDK